MQERYAGGPSRWWELELAPHLRRLVAPDPPAHSLADPLAHRPAGAIHRLDAVLADGARMLHERHRVHGLAGGEQSVAAATYAVTELVDTVGTAVGFAWATARVGLIPRALDATWEELPGGYLRGRVGAAPAVRAAYVVARDHPWAHPSELADAPTEVVEDDDAVAHRVLAAYVGWAEPIVTAVKGLDRVGPGPLWDEVADSLGMALAHSPGLEWAEAAQLRLDGLLARTDAPWRRTPWLGDAVTARGARHVAQKGGCCLAYLGAPTASGEPDHCGSCRFRERDDVVARQVAWLGRPV